MVICRSLAKPGFANQMGFFQILCLAEWICSLTSQSLGSDTLDPRLLLDLLWKGTFLEALECHWRQIVAIWVSNDNLPQRGSSSNII